MIGKHSTSYQASKSGVIHVYVVPLCCSMYSNCLLSIASVLLVFGGGRLQWCDTTFLVLLLCRTNMQKNNSDQKRSILDNATKSSTICPGFKGPRYYTTLLVLEDEPADTGTLLSLSLSILVSSSFVGSIRSIEKVCKMSRQNKSHNSDESSVQSPPLGGNVSVYSECLIGVSVRLPVYLLALFIGVPSE